MDEGRAQALAQCDADEMPLIIFIGDGVSDLAAARQADVLFARQGLALEKHCQDNNIPFTPFVSFVDIKSEIEKISREDQAKTGGVGKPVRYNPRANMWRRISSKEAVRSPATLQMPEGKNKTMKHTHVLVTDSHGCRYPHQGGENVPLARNVFGAQARDYQREQSNCLKAPVYAL